MITSTERTVKSLCSAPFVAQEDEGSDVLPDGFRIYCGTEATEWRLAMGTVVMAGFSPVDVRPMSCE